MVEIACAPEKVLSWEIKIFYLAKRTQEQERLLLIVKKI